MFSTCVVKVDFLIIRPKFQVNEKILEAHSGPSPTSKKDLFAKITALSKMFHFYMFHWVLNAPLKLLHNSFLFQFSPLLFFRRLRTNYFFCDIYIYIYIYINKVTSWRTNFYETYMMEFFLRKYLVAFSCQLFSQKSSIIDAW